MIYEVDGLKPVIAPSAFISESAVIIGDVRVGEDCYIGPGAILRADSHGMPIIIGNGSAIEEGVIIHVGGRGTNGCCIGERVTIGHGAIVHANRIADNANIGMGAVISLYSTIGSYAIVAEGAVVKQAQVIPDRVVVGGAPAKILRELEDRDIATWDKTKLWYIELARKYTTPGVLKRLDI